MTGQAYTSLQDAVEGAIVAHRNPPGVAPYGMHYHGVLVVDASGEIVRVCPHEHRSEAVARRCHAEPRD